MTLHEPCQPPWRTTHRDAPGFVQSSLTKARLVHNGANRSLAFRSETSILSLSKDAALQRFVA
jgi:hypothetical protein